MTGLEVGLAIPGLIELTIKSAKKINEKINTFKNGDEAVRRLQQSAKNLKEGHLHLGLEALKIASKKHRIYKPFTNLLKEKLEGVTSCLATIEASLDSVDTVTFIGRFHYTFSRGRGSQHQLSRLAQTLENGCGTLMSSCLQLYIAKNMESSHLLTSENFVIHQERFDRDAGSMLKDSDIRILQGQYTKDEPKTSFIVEDVPPEERTEHLCTKLSYDSIDGRGGVLPLLDSHKRRRSNLIFKLPAATSHESLAHILRTEPQPGICDQLGLCLQLARALRTWYL